MSFKVLPTSTPAAPAAFNSATFTYDGDDKRVKSTFNGTYHLLTSDSQGGEDYSSKKGANAPKLLVALGGATAQSSSSVAAATFNVTAVG